jgi:K+-transporting ATPase ATPase A chain
MAGLAWHNFISAAAGIAIAVALAARPHAARGGQGPGTIGNFWVDLTRATVYVLLPLSIVFALVFVSQGMIQNLAPYRRRDARGRQAGRSPWGRRLAGGDQAARDERRRLLQRQRRASLREPEPADELPLDVPDLRDPRGLTYTFGRMAGPAPGLGAVRRDGAPLLRGRDVAYWAEAAGNPIATALGVDPGSGTWRARRSASASRTRRSTRP